MDKFNCKFCEEFHYPEQIRELIQSFSEICCQYLGNNLIAIMLVGSSARGELSYFNNNKGDLLIYSDLEFLVYVKKRVNRKLHQDIMTKVKKLAEPHTQKSPFFHIDICIAPIRTIKKSRKFFTFESKVTGKIVYGMDIKPMIQSVNSSNLNFRELNEILLHRLWSMLLYLPEEFLITKKNLVELNYILSRNVLDITTWLLPYERKELIAGFRNRLDFINMNWNNLSFKKFFTLEDLHFLNRCIDGKMRLFFLEPTHIIYKNTIQLFVKSIKYMLFKNGFNLDNNNYQNCLFAHAKNLFEGQTIKKKIWEAYVIKSKIGEYSFYRLLRWVCWDKRALCILFILNMHLANIAFIENGYECFLYLERAKNFLEKLKLNNMEVRGGYIKQWIQLRKGYIDFLVEFDRWYRFQKGYLYKVVNYNYSDNE